MNTMDDKGANNRRNDGRNNYGGDRQIDRQVSSQGNDMNPHPCQIPNDARPQTTGSSADHVLNSDAAANAGKHPDRISGHTTLPTAIPLGMALSTRKLSRQWGAFRANDDITLDLEAGARHALIGPNGAGKTTLINLLSGALAPTSGQVLLDGEDISALAQHQRVRRGITRTFQINTLFAGLTVLESVLLAIGERSGRQRNWWRPLATEHSSIAEAWELLERLHLDCDAAVQARHLPYGKQRLLEIALALATRPVVLLLDEPAAGVPAAESAELFRVIAALPTQMSIVLIEHDMDLVFRFAKRITVMLAGAVLCEGRPDEIADDKRVREVYLGEH